MLRTEKLDVHFGSFRALTDISVEVRPGEVVGVIGPNGAGKSTLVNALSGVVAPSAGSVVLDGQTLGRTRPVRRSRLGLVRTFQTAQLFGSLSARSNIDLARRGRGSGAVEDLLDAATEILRLDAVLDLAADRLSGGQRKLVEFVRALAAEPQVLLLDEPVAGVPMHDRAHVLDLIRRHLTEREGSVVLIEHDMEFVSSVCDRVYVMNAGAVIAHGTWAEISHDPAVLEAYLGTAPTAPAGAEN
ncbi:ABC transporter ATP-binding protein [Pseudonocardia sp. N23]|uniref:ABC transporter ATP-binding protein n=1 Tax=Pseudonocardia sp. N23 TaxID=1987376 RepID=UPI000C0388F1|nr:ABC transporter ATP-binding protein [Pseudonocardia sp. N23]GAY10992.1 branched-chain amino acid transport ATP-binding protein LivG [Pseudonocardia sp. N23]